MLKKKIWANFQRIIELFTPKIVTKLSKKWVWDPGYGKNLFRIQGQKGTGFRIRKTVRIRLFLGLPDPDPLVQGTDPGPALDPSIIKHSKKKVQKTLNPDPLVKRCGYESVSIPECQDPQHCV